MQVPFSSHSKERTCTEFGTDLKRRKSEGEAELKQMKNTGSEKTFSRKPYTPTSAPYVTCTMLVRYVVFKYMQTLHQPYITPTPEPKFF